MIDKIVSWIEGLKTQSNARHVYELLAIKKFALLLEEEIGNINLIDKTQLILCLDSLRSRLKKIQSLTEKEIPIKQKAKPPIPKIKCAECGIYKELHDNIKHEFKK